jgi:flagellar hook-length control protein FliK
VFSPPPAAEPPPQRSRAPDAQRGGQDFTLPDANDDKRPAPQAKSTTTRDASASADGKAPDAGAGDEPAAGQGKSAAPSAAKSSDGAGSQAAPSPATQVVAGQKPPIPSTDIGALASILAAAGEAAGKSDPAQVVPLAQVIEDAAVPTVVKPGKKKTGDETEAVEPSPEPVATTAPPVPSMSAATDLMALLGAGAAVTDAQNAAGDGKEQAGVKTVSLGAHGLPAAVLQRVAADTPDPAIASGPPVIETGVPGESAGAVPAAQLGVKGHTATEAAAPGKIDPDLAPMTQPNAQPSQAEPKLPETVQQALAPIDLSALVAQASGKPATAHPQALALQDPTAAQGQTALQAPANGTSMPTPLHVLPIEIGMRALGGAKRFDIRLDPAELGRVDVNLSISDKGEVSARLVVDRVETLHLLQRDARTLERAFEQAGLKPSDSGVDITLRDNSEQAFRQQRQQDEAPHRQRNRVSQTDEVDGIGGLAAVATQPSRQIVRLGGVDLSI